MDVKVTGKNTRKFHWDMIWGLMEEGSDRLDDKYLLNGGVQKFYNKYLGYCVEVSYDRYEDTLICHCSRE